jgi:hypothetical protein
MATAAQVQTLATKGEKLPEIHCWLQLAAPAVEARALFRLVGKNGNTVEKIRALIAVPPAKATGAWFKIVFQRRSSYLKLTRICLTFLTASIGRIAPAPESPAAPA